MSSSLANTQSQRATLPCVMKSTLSKFRGAVPKSSITRRSHSASRASTPAARLGSRKVSSSSGSSSGSGSSANSSDKRSNHPLSANYAPRVLAGQFEPTALRARQIAADRGQTLHELAHELGYAPPPPAIRQSVSLTAHSRTEVAALTGYDITDISRLFARRHPPTLTKLARVAAAYNATLDDMLTALGW